jgi:hypothetical protein
MWFWGDFFPACTWRVAVTLAIVSASPSCPSFKDQFFL